MKTPTWATITGIVMIVLGGCSVMNDFKSIRLPEDLEKAMVMIKEKREAKKKEKDHVIKEQDHVITGNADSLSTDDEEEKEGEHEEDSVSFAGGNKKSVEEFLQLNDFTKTWIVRFGYIGLFSSVLYVIGGIFLLVKRSYSIKLAYAVLFTSIALSGAQAAVLLSTSSSGVIALSTGLAQGVGIVVDIILLAVIFTSDKEAYVFPKDEPGS